MVPNMVQATTVRILSILVANTAKAATTAPMEMIQAFVGTDPPHRDSMLIMPISMSRPLWRENRVERDFPFLKGTAAAMGCVEVPVLLSWLSEDGITGRAAVGYLTRGAPRPKINKTASPSIG